MTVDEAKQRAEHIAIGHMFFDEPMHGFSKALDDLCTAQDEATRKEIAEAESKTLSGQQRKAQEALAELWHKTLLYQAVEWCADRPWVVWLLSAISVLYVGISCAMTAMDK